MLCCGFLTRELCAISGANLPALVHFFKKVWDLRSLFHKLLSVAGGDGVSNESNTESRRHTPLPAETLAGETSDLDTPLHDLTETVKKEHCRPLTGQRIVTTIIIYTTQNIIKKKLLILYYVYVQGPG